MSSIVRIMLTVLILGACTLAAFVGGGMAMIIFFGQNLDQPWVPIAGYSFPVAGFLLGAFLSAKLLGGKPQA